MNEKRMMNVAIIGGGAAGFFLAVNLKMFAPHASITIFEKQDRVLKKVLVSGGGRCNLTNTFEEVVDLKQVYPRGDKLLKGLFKSFDHREACRWFESQGVRLTFQEDHCVFPASQDAHSIAGCLTRLAEELSVVVKTSHGVERVRFIEGKFEIVFRHAPASTMTFDKVAITTGGSPRGEGLRYLQELGHKIEQPVPSLFTFNIADRNLRELMGMVVETATASIPGTKFKASGALLVTHWGMSGPAILKLSSHAARFMHGEGYQVPLLVNWTSGKNTEEVTEVLKGIAGQFPKKDVQNIRPFELPARLWCYLTAKAEIPAGRKWSELGRKNINKLADTLCNDRYMVEGKSAFREEFVTCGGISLESVHRNTLESKVCPGLYFAGEVLDIDGVTGGFNFQAAWSTAHAVARALAQEL